MSAAPGQGGSARRTEMNGSFVFRFTAAPPMGKHALSLPRFFAIVKNLFRLPRDDHAVAEEKDLDEIPRYNFISLDEFGPDCRVDPSMPIEIPQVAFVKRKSFYGVNFFSHCLSRAKSRPPVCPKPLQVWIEVMNSPVANGAKPSNVQGF
jgi:hypothetical protein